MGIVALFYNRETEAWKKEEFAQGHCCGLDMSVNFHVLETLSPEQCWEGA
jgi:hypothetical protein